VSVKDARGHLRFCAKAEGAYGQDNWMKKEPQTRKNAFVRFSFDPLYILRSCSIHLCS